MLFGVAMILSGSLMPFQIAPGRTVRWQLGSHGPAPGDFAANILIYVPIGMFLCLILHRRGSSWMSECLPSILMIAALSYLTEAAQTILVARVPAWTDAISNMIGATIGIMLAPTIQRMLRNLHANM